MADRDALITFLEGLTHPQMASLILRVPGAGQADRPNASETERVAALVHHAESSAGPGLETLMQAVTAQFGDAWRTRSTPSTPPFMVPFPQNPFFVGREDTLTDLETALTGKGVAAITQVVRGLGGMGKTQTAVEYAYRHKDRYSAVLWTRADDENALIAGFVNIAKAWGLPGADSPETGVAVRAAREALGERSGWLFIVDNADSPEIVPNFLPTKPQGDILVTSRAENFRMLGTLSSLLLQPLPEEDALTFFTQSANLNRADTAEIEAAKRLATKLGYLPLALEQAAAYIIQKQRSFRAFLREFQKERAAKGMLQWKPDVGTAKVYDKDSDEYKEYLTVWTTWQLNFDAVRERAPDSADLLTLCAFLAPNAIPQELVAAAFPERFNGLETDEDRETTYTDLLLPLAHYSLITEDRANYTFSVHRMVQTVLHDRLGETERQQWHTRTVDALNRALPSANYDPVRWRIWDRMLPHCLAIGVLLEKIPHKAPEIAFLLSQTAYYLGLRGQFGTALPLHQRALEIYEKALGPEHPDTATSINNLAYLFKVQGDYASALPLYKRALEIREKALRPEHPQTATSVNNLAALYDSMGDYASALPLYKRALEIREKALGPEHPDTATSVNNLANLYRAQGKYASALSLFERALEIYEKVLGPEHPQTATSVNNLAYLYYAQDDYTSALPLYQRALEIYEKVLGPEHPQTATSVNNLASLYYAQDDYASALPLYQRALAICEKALGPEHPDTAQSVNNLAYLYQTQGDYASALPLYQRALAICEKALGEEHPTTAIICGNVAGCYAEMEQISDGLPYYERSQEIKAAHERRNRME